MKKKQNKTIVERFETNLFSFISEYIEKKERFVLAVSGGMDSMVMLDLFESLKEKQGVEFCVANLDHCIREESQSEQQWLKEYCLQKAIPFYSKRVDVLNYKIKNGAKYSVEEIARDERYQFLNEAKEAFDSNWILTAHHKDDLLETFLIRLLRGTGVNGLDVLNRTDSPFMRPLINFWREEIEEYVKFKELYYFEDESNKDEKYLRNRVRRKLIPFISSEFGDVSKTILIRDLTNIKSSGRLIEEYLQQYISQCEFSEEEITFNASLFADKSEDFIKEFLIRVYQKWNGSPIGLSRQKINDIYSRIKCKGDFELSIIEEIKFLRIDKCLKFKASCESASSYKKWEFVFDFKKELIEKNVFYLNSDKFNPGYLLAFELMRDTTEIDKTKKNVVYLDFEKLRFPVKLRFWREGDKFRPLGMCNKKRLSRFFTNEGISKFKKREQLIMEDVKHDIICCIGLRCSEDYKVTKKTRSVLKIEYK
jgi:tRNA(Ile)-lysidine synthase